MPAAGTPVGLSAAESLPQVDSKAASRQDSPMIAVWHPNAVAPIASATTPFRVAPAAAPLPLLLLGWRVVKGNACPLYASGVLILLRLRCHRTTWQNQNHV